MENLQEVKIKIVPFENKEHWNSILFDMPNFHYLQTKEWGEFKAKKGWEPLKYIIEDEKGETVGVMQALKKKTVLRKNILYCPKGPTIKEPFASDARFWKSFGKEIKKVADDNNAFLVKIEPQTPASEAIPATDFIKTRSIQMTDCTIINDLTASEEELFEKIKKNARYDIRLAEKNDVVIKEDSSPEGIKKFLELYYVTGKRIGLFLREEKYMTETIKIFADKGMAKIFLAEHDGKALSGAVIFILGEKAWYVYGGSVRDDEKITSSYLLQFEIMKYLKKIGIARYDFGGVPCEKDPIGQKNMAGLRVFKSRFGGDYTEFAGSFDIPTKKFYYRVWLKTERFVKKYYKLFKRDLFY